jgi:organic hydroperoxide reductase OsmC/OhrA
MPWANPDAVDPEEAFVASAASCHMLFFLDFARRAGVIVTSYDDEAEGEMAKGDDGKMRITRITLRPKIAYGDIAPTEEMLDDLHHKAHEACFIANSITSEILIEPR